MITTTILKIALRDSWSKTDEETIKNTINLLEKWSELIEILERNDADPNFVAECIYLQIDDYDKLNVDLISFLEKAN
ncbi:hypothetical protein BKP37_12625 [Anaerobacillus alkalilacustris]|uniref:Uncharacterized protein n=1 Tax=Anaerobacillus alkalilacustris TaxID=393763 RepID=A0A1S2LJF6_9BACI|nr:hypothetical protein [Anaerobacillus alkalilacustris]OIJ12642.1 hypothetical protein BKP37_12625 [Anaerobacillus alkalilacustris]